MKVSKSRLGGWTLVALLSAGCSAPRPLESPSTEADTVSDPRGQSSLLPIDDDDPVWGKAAAPVTVMTFLDFECPYCRVAYPTLLELQRKYGPERLRFVFKHYPLPTHRKGINAARAAQAVYSLGGAHAFFAYEHVLYDAKVDPEEFSPERLGALAAEVGIAPEKFMLAYDSKAVRASVWHDIQFAQAIGVSGVPAFLINGIPVVGAVPIEELETIIDSELEAAATARKQGVPALQIYDRRIRVNRKLTTAIEI